MNSELGETHLINQCNINSKIIALRSKKNPMGVVHDNRLLDNVDPDNNAGHVRRMTH